MHPKFDQAAVATVYQEESSHLIPINEASELLPNGLRAETEFVHLLRRVLKKVFHVRWYRVASSYSPGVISVIQNCYIACKFSGAIACRQADIPKWLFTCIITVAGFLALYSTGGFARNYDKEICKFCGIPRDQKAGSRSIAKALTRVFFNCLAFVEMIKTLLKIEGSGAGTPCMSNYILTAWWTIPAGFMACAVLSAPQMWVRFGPPTSYALYGDKLTALFFVAAGYIKTLVPSVSKLMTSGASPVITIEMVLGGFGSVFRYISQKGFNEQRREKLTASEQSLQQQIIPNWNRGLNKITQCGCHKTAKQAQQHSKAKILATISIGANAAGGYFFTSILEFVVMTMTLLFCDPDTDTLFYLELALYSLFGLFILLLFAPAGMTRNFRYLFGEAAESMPISTSSQNIQTDK